MTNQVSVTLDGQFQAAIPVLEKLEQHGYEAYFVGGSVRDALLGYPINDIDIASSAFPEEVKGLFLRTVDVGIEHGTVMVLEGENSYEITTFRTESTYQDYRRPDHVTFVRSLKEDLKRRDFTINAFAMNKDGQIIDYFQGLDDLDQQVIRAVGQAEDRFNEDALRMMRALRFQSQLNFSIEEQTLQAIRDKSYLLEKIAVERIHVELMKLMQGQAMPRGIQSFVNSQAFVHCPHLDGHANDLLEMCKYQQQLDNDVQAWTLLLFFLKKDESSTSSFLKAWKASNDTIAQVKACLKALKYRVQKGEWSKRLLYESGQDVILNVERLLQGLSLSKETDLDAALEAYQSLSIKTKDELAISGSDILNLTELKPGKWLGQLLNDLERRVVESELENTSSVLLKEARLRIKEMETDLS